MDERCATDAFFSVSISARTSLRATREISALRIEAIFGMSALCRFLVSWQFGQNDHFERLLSHEPFHSKTIRELLKKEVVTDGLGTPSRNEFVKECPAFLQPISLRPRSLRRSIPYAFVKLAS
ncbi:hypothetical protein D3C71_1360230 [compost metagenome]